MPAPSIEVHPLSLPSLRLTSMAGEVPLAEATGFVAHRDGRNFLITNGHVVTARNAITGDQLTPGDPTPDSLFVRHHVMGQLGRWIGIRVPLFTPDATAKWLEHPTGLSVDVVAVPFGDTESIQLFPFPLELARVDAVPEPAMSVSIIGYPFGISVGDILPVWKTGHIASDPAVDFNGQPSFLIDATTRGGMSGSPVVLKTHGGYRTSDGRRPMRDITKFLGVYSGRIDRRAEIGIVWKPRVIDEILA